jgi:DNA polymerase
MILLAADFETFFSRDYTLTKLTTEAYVRDARFLPIGLGVVCPELKYKQFMRPEHIAGWCAAWERKVGWKNTQLLTHHAQFDGLIFAHHFGVIPGLHLDTLSMARVQLGVHLSASLDALAKYYGLPSKNVPYNEFKGVPPSQIPPGLFDRIAHGCLHDTELALEIFSRLLVGFPREELETIDTTIRMFTEPALAADFAVLKDLWLSENARRYGALAELGVTDKEINSDATFIQLLEAEGIEIVYKDGKNGPIPAFAKNDEFMEELLEHPNARVSVLATSRLGLRSTIDQTRAERFGSMATRGPMTVYLRYGGAHTTRWAGGDNCLTADTQVLVLDIAGTPKYKNIVDVLLTDLVWDGEEFVEHEGVVFNGYRKVISWDGINGTPEHTVLCEETWKSLGEALRDATPVMDCREPTMREVEAGQSVQRKRAKGTLRVHLRKT